MGGMPEGPAGAAFSLSDGHMKGQSWRPERTVAHTGTAEVTLTCSHQAVEPALRVVKVVRNQRVCTAEQVQQHKEVLGKEMVIKTLKKATEYMLFPLWLKKNTLIKEMIDY